MNILALRRQYDPLPPNFEEGDELWSIDAISSQSNGLPIGYVTIKLNRSKSPRPLVEYVFVHSDHRQAGVAKSMFKRVIEEWGGMDITGSIGADSDAFVSFLRRHPEIGPKIHRIF